MAEPVNLNKARKAKARTAAKAEAAQNRVAFGLSKLETSAAKAAKDKARRDLDGAKRES